jgi:PAS domain S-box-containing protein
MLPRSQSWLNLLIGALFLFVVVNGAVSYVNLRRLRESAVQVTRSYAVLEALESTLSTLTDAETGQRGYLIARDPQYLGPYEAAVASAGEELKGLSNLSAASPRLKVRVPEIEALTSRKLGELAETLALARAGQFDKAIELVRTDRGKQTMDQLRQVVADLQQEEFDLLAQRQIADAGAFRRAVAGVVAAAVVGLGALGAILAVLHRHLQSMLQFNERLHQQQDLLHATLLSIGDAVIVTDSEGKVTFLNPIAERLTGWPQADAAGTDLSEVFKIVNESTRTPVDNPALRSLREGKIVGLANHTILISKSGTEWPIDDSAAPIRTAAGEVCGAVLVFRDITDRKKQEAAMKSQTDALQAANERQSDLLAELRASEELFHGMADSIPQLAWMTRPDGHIYWYNQRWYEYTGTTPEQMEGWGWQSVHDPNELPRVMANWKTALDSQQAWEDTFPLRRHDGAMRWHLSRAVPVCNDHGEVVRWFGTNTDITERLEMEQALREADHRKDEFLATLAHELRNPIAPISNALQVWPMVENDQAEVEKLRAIMERQIRQMSRLIDDLLDVSRITRGKIQLRRQPVDLNTIVEGAVEAVAPLIDSCGHNLEVVKSPLPAMVDGDVARLTQIVGNLLNNAAKYTPREGHIKVVVDRDQANAIIRVSDNGAGIPHAMVDKIFEMFQQVDQTLDRAHGGLGLGLTLVKRLVALHGGDVVAFSEGEGSGSEFVVHLPLFVSQSAQLPAQPIAPRGGVPRHRVLVVDDVYASAKTLAMMLQSINQDVEIANDGPSAIEQADQRRPDVVFLDIAMPGMNGYDVARAMRQKPELVKTCLVALTGYGHEDDRRRAIEAGFHHHLTKPTSIDQLTQLLSALPVSGDG